MKSKKINKRICGIAAVIFAALLLIGGIIYAAKLKKADIDFSASGVGHTRQESDADSVSTPVYKPGDLISESLSGRVIQLADEEKILIEADMQAVGKLCSEYYLKSEKISSEYFGQDSIRQTDIDAMENALISSGYCTENSDAVYPEYLENADSLSLFWKNVEQSGDGQTSVWSVFSTGSVFCNVFQYANGKGYCIHASGDWNNDGSLSLTYIEKKEILYWEMTESGFIYQDTYPDRHWNAAHLLRLHPADKELYDFNMKYILPIGYRNVNLFLLDWDSDNYGNLCFNDMLDSFYRLSYGDTIYAGDYPFFTEPYSHSAIPAELFEDLILPRFDISKAEFRKRALYDAESNTYPWQEINWENVLYYQELIPEVTKVTENSDGTVTLLVNVICPDNHAPHLFEHEVTMRIEPDGAFRYLSNKIVCRSENELPSPQTRIEVQHFNTVINCAARYSSFGDDVIRYEPVVMDKSSAAPVHKKLVLRNNRFISGTGRNHNIDLNYLGEAVIEGNTSDVKLEIINNP